MSIHTHYESALRDIQFIYETDAKLNAAIDSFKKEDSERTKAAFGEIMNMADELQQVRSRFPRNKRMYSIPDEQHFWEVSQVVERTVKRIAKLKAKFSIVPFSQTQNNKDPSDFTPSTDHILEYYTRNAFFNWMIDNMWEAPSEKKRAQYVAKIREQVHDFRWVVSLKNDGYGRMMDPLEDSPYLKMAIERSFKRANKLKTRYPALFGDLTVP